MDLQYHIDARLKPNNHEGNQRTNARTRIVQSQMIYQDTKSNQQ